MVKVYVEGGGNSNNLKTELRKAFQSFFKSAGIENKPRVVACGSRNEAFSDFCNAFSNRQDEEVLLLVDSEVPVSHPNVFAQLKSSDKWCFPRAVDESSIHLTRTSSGTKMLKIYKSRDALETLKECINGFQPLTKVSRPSWSGCFEIFCQKKHELDW